MAHREQKVFVQSVKSLLPEKFKGVDVLDVGSCDNNGNNRYLFEDCIYTGLDIAEGPNVDVVSPIHLFETSNLYGVVISTECLEHDMHYEASLTKMVDLLKPEGLLVLTCATTGRPEHGTRRTSGRKDSLTASQDGPWSDYYRNLTEADIRSVLDIDLLFSDYKFTVETRHKDLYFWGVKK
jgi:hypothetical protein